MTSIAFRAIALVIVIAGAIDPSWPREQTVPSQLSLVVVSSPSMQWPGADATTRFDSALSSAARLTAALGEDVAGRVLVASASSASAACQPDLPCVLLTDGAVPDRLLGSGARLLGVVRIGVPAGDQVRVAAVDSALVQHPGALGEVRVRLDGEVTDGATSTVTIRDDGIPVGQTAHAWTAGARDAIVRVPWAPLGPGPRQLHITVDGQDSDSVRGNNSAETGVNVAPTTYDVLVYEPRVSWGVTFARRAIEADPRFRVRARSRVAPGLDVSGGEPFGLDDHTLTEARVVIAGAPELLTEREVAALERFVRARGGGLVLLPDRPMTGPVNRLAPQGAREQLTQEPVAVGLLKASERLVWPGGAGGAGGPGGAGEGQDLWSLDGPVDEPTVVARRVGDGQVIVSGAMDAWRWRADGERAFDSYWQGLIAGAALDAGGPLEVDVHPRRPAPGQDVGVLVRLRTAAGSFTSIEVAATAACPGAPVLPVRLWPTDATGGFKGTFVAPASTSCEIRARATAGGSSWDTAVAIPIAAGVTVPQLGVAPRTIESIASRLGAPVMPPGEEAALAAAVHERLHGGLESRPVHPMRSPSWLLPLFACLGAEWWLRRTRGLR